MDREAWRGAIHGAAKSQTQLSDWTQLNSISGFPSGIVVKNPPASAGDVISILGSMRSPEKGNGNPLQYSCLGNLMNRGARTRDRTCVSSSGRWVLYFWDTREALFLLKNRIVVGMMSKSDNNILYCLNLYNWYIIYILDWSKCSFEFFLNSI